MSAPKYTIPHGFREVTREEFFGTVGQQNVTPIPRGERHPYYSEWRTPSGDVLGWSHEGIYAVRHEEAQATARPLQESAYRRPQ